MTSFKIDVKWQKELFKGVEVDTSLPPLVFKTQLFSLSGVPPERQMIMGLKGGLLKDNTEWSKTGIRDGMKLTMMGTAAAVPEAPKEAVTFVEDLPEAEQDTTGLSKYGAGLENLGNTCYMNSTIQCLFSVDGLREALADGVGRPSPGPGPARGLVPSSRALFDRLTRSAAPVTPSELLEALRSEYPQFGQRTREGFFMQQDAEECWSSLVYSLKEGLKGLPPAVGAAGGTPAATPSPVDRLLEVRLKSHLVAPETGETWDSEASSYSLKCNITGEVNVLAEGLRLGLKDDRERTSPSLGRVVPFRGSSELASLPPFLTVQMVRFFYKADAGQKAKILRKVAFPAVLDVHEFLTPELQAVVKPARLLEQTRADAAQGLKAARADAADPGTGAARDGAAEASSSSPAPKRPKSAQGEAATVADGGSGGAPTRKGLPTGRYRLQAVLTHKGRSADSGHYVAWVRQADGTWILFDDDTLSVKKEDEVLALAGGGDWHMAYMLLYKSIDVEPDA